MMSDKEIEELKIKETELKRQLSEIDNKLYYNKRTEAMNRVRELYVGKYFKHCGDDCNFYYHFTDVKTAYGGHNLICDYIYHSPDNVEFIVNNKYNYMDELLSYTEITSEEYHGIVITVIGELMSKFGKDK